jgi:hypothetical protein
MIILTCCRIRIFQGVFFFIYKRALTSRESNGVLDGFECRPFIVIEHHGPWRRWQRVRRLENGQHLFGFSGPRRQRIIPENKKLFYYFSISKQCRGSLRLSPLIRI